MGEVMIAKAFDEINELTVSKDTKTGIKDSKGKIRWSLLPFEALEPIVRVLDYGATTKYAMDNWKYVDHKGPYMDSLIRHWKKYFIDMEEIDPESGESHLANLGCGLLFLIYDRQVNNDIPFVEYIENLKQYPDYVTELDTKKFQ